jgi:hypothetical protein
VRGTTAAKAGHMLFGFDLVFWLAISIVAITMALSTAT